MDASSAQRGGGITRPRSDAPARLMRGTCGWYAVLVLPPEGLISPVAAMSPLPPAAWSGYPYVAATRSANAWMTGDSDRLLGTTNATPKVMAGRSGTPVRPAIAIIDSGRMPSPSLRDPGFCREPGPQFRQSCTGRAEDPARIAFSARGSKAISRSGHSHHGWYCTRRDGANGKPGPDHHRLAGLARDRPAGAAHDPAGHRQLADREADRGACAQP